MLVNKIIAGCVCASRVNIGIVTVHQDVGMLVLQLQRRRKQVRGPENAVGGRPCFLWVAVEAVDQDDVRSRLRMGVNRCDFEARDLPVDTSLYSASVFVPSRTVQMPLL